ncbi:MAG TPA: PIN domain-containing protein [Candidatus Xenobia bacterium]|jgi:hypothetical protein
MRVLIDTAVWSLAFRRARVTPGPVVQELRLLIEEGRASIVAPIRQELLSGIRHLHQYETLRNALRAFPDLATDTQDYELGADFFNRCRGRGIQGSNTDFLVCAVAHRMGTPIFTTDQDFESFAQCLPIALHRPRSSR